MGREHHAHGVVLHIGRDRHAAHEPLRAHDPIGIEHALQLWALACRGAVEDHRQLLARRVPDHQLEEESVELGLGQGIG
ncbi:MAG: hypothetical protein ACK559_30080, partial [bacterium]